MEGFEPNPSKNLNQILERIWTKFLEGFEQNLKKNINQILRKIWTKSLEWFELKPRNDANVFNKILRKIRTKLKKNDPKSLEGFEASV